MIIRKIHPTEIDNIVTLTEYFRDDLDLDDFDSDKMLETIREYTIQITHSWLVAFDNQRPVGFIAGHLNQLPWCHDLFAIVELFYLIPSHNNDEYRQALYQEFEDWAKNLDVTCIKIVRYGNEPQTIKDFYTLKSFVESANILDKVTQ